jgi:CheY-like chemotaxis protein
MSYLLIIDDDPEFAGAVATVCESEGHEVRMLHTPEAVDAVVKERRPDGILLDVMFPENPSAGFEIARRIRRDFGTIPILLLTAVNQQFPLGFSSKDIDPKWLPVTGFVEKPVDFAVLKEKVAELVASPSDSPS